MVFICAPEGVYAFSESSDYINKIIHKTKNNPDCSILNDFRKTINEELSLRVQYTQTTFKKCIDELMAVYNKFGINLLFRPTPGFNLNKKTHRSATKYSLPAEMFTKQIELAPLIDIDYILKLDYSEIDEFDRFKAGIEDDVVILSGLLFTEKKLLFAPYGMREIEVTLMEDENEKKFIEKYLSSVYIINSFAVTSIILLFTDDKFPFTINLRLVKLLNKHALAERGKMCVIMSESYITIFDFVKNELRGPLNKKNKKYILEHERH
jgi:hypothetical protein